MPCSRDVGDIYIGVHGIGMVVYVLFCGGHFIGW